MIELGSRVKDRITGLEGTAVARHQYLWGCARYSVQADGEKDGKPIDPAAYDEPQLEVLAGPPQWALDAMQAEAPQSPAPGSDRLVRRTGGPQDEPSRVAIPRR